MKILESDRLILRMPRADEAEAIYRVLVDEIEGESFSRDDFDSEFQFDLAMVHQPLGQVFGRPAVYLKPSHRYIGYCLLMPRLCSPEEIGREVLTPTAGHSIEAEFGWAISEKYRNQGYAAEAACLLVEYVFSNLRLPRVVAFTNRSNPASLRVMQKVGMRIFDMPEPGEVAGVLEEQTTGADG